MSRKIFDHQPSLQEYFETSDGKKFYSHNAATNHAATLANKAVKNFKREEVSKEAKEDSSVQEAKTEASEKEAQEAEAKAKEVSKEAKEDSSAQEAKASEKEAQEPEAKAKEETTAKMAEAPIKKMVPAKNTNKKPSNTVK